MDNSPVRDPDLAADLDELRGDVGDAIIAMRKQVESLARQVAELRHEKTTMGHLITRLEYRATSLEGKVRELSHTRPTRPLAERRAKEAVDVEAHGTLPQLRGLLRAAGLDERCTSRREAISRLQAAGKL